MKKQVFTLKDVTEIFGLSKQTILNWVKTKKLNPLDDTAGKFLFRRSEIEKILGEEIQN